MIPVSENEFGFTFAGIHSREFNLRIVDIKRNILPLLTENAQTIPGMRGNLYQGTSQQSKSIDVDVVIVSSTHEERADLVHQIAEWIMPLSTGEYELIFDDEPEYSYYAHVTSATQITNLLYEGETTITFTCSDPLAYGLQQTIKMDKYPFIFTPDGLSECFPVFTCIPKKDATKIAIVDQDGNYVYVGEDVDPDTNTQPVDNEPRAVWDTCNTFGVGWSAFNQTDDKPAVIKPTPFNSENDKVPSDARMQSDVESFHVQSWDKFGTNPKDSWYGPMIQRAFPKAYQDWRITIRFSNYQYYSRARGKIDFYLLGSDGKRIGLFYLKDNGDGEDVIASIDIGDHDPKKDTRENLIYTRGTVHNARKKTLTVKYKSGTKKIKSHGKTKTVTVWKTVHLQEDPDTDSFTHFFGSFTLQKIGNKYMASIMKNNTKTHAPMWSKPFTGTFTDKDGKYDNALAGCAVFIGKWGIYNDDHGISYTNNHMQITDIKVYEIQNGGNNAANAPVIIAHSGDEVKIDCEQGEVFRNGNPDMSHLFIGSNFMKMKGGVPSSFGFEPSLEDADWTMDYRPTKP